MCHKLRNVDIHLVYISMGWQFDLWFELFFWLPWIWELDTKLSVFSWSTQANLSLSLTRYDRCLLYRWRECCLKPTRTVLMSPQFTFVSLDKGTRFLCTSPVFSFVQIFLFASLVFLSCVSSCNRCPLPSRKWQWKPNCKLVINAMTVKWIMLLWSWGGRGGVVTPPLLFKTCICGWAGWFTGAGKEDYSNR